MNMSIGFVNRALPCALLGLVLCASSGFAQPAPNRTPQHPPKRETPFAPNRYILFLQDEPVSARFAKREDLQTAAAVSYRQQVESRQRSVMQDLAGRKITVAGSVSVVMNAIFVVAPPERLAELRSVPGVVGVMPERRVKPSLSKATTLANAPAAWAQTAIGGQSNAGNGIKIGILDTGIDQTHPAFSDAGFTLPTTGTWPKCNVPSDCTNYTNKKVIVARSYVPMIAAGSNPASPAVDSNPDDFSARDHDGHGSAVAAAAAAVQNSGGTVAFSGMAPKAYLGSYKIFGSPYVNGGASESILIKALDDAVSDGMDIVNMSSGAPALTGALDVTQCGNTGTTPCDPLATAFETAAKAGLVITASVGNSGSDPYFYLGENYPYYNGITSPATAPSVIGVGATVNSHVFNASVTVNAATAPASLKGIAAAMSDDYFYPSYVGSNTGPLIDVTTLDPTGQACSALPALSLTDKYVLIQNGGPSTCTVDTKNSNASAAGAIGVIFYMATSAAPVYPEGNFAFVGPEVMISLSAGQALKTYLQNNPGASVTIDTAGSEQLLTSLVNTLASYSSFGPTPDGAIKPDIVATGGYDYWQFPDPNDSYLPAPYGLYTVGQNYDPNGALFTTNRYVAVDGTSLAAPLVAGAAALVKQAHPGWTATQIKSALMNYSAQDVTADDFGDPVDVQSVGAGRLDANAAVIAAVTAEPSSLSFGYLKSGVALPKPIAVTVTNKGTSSVTLTVAAAPGALSASTTTSVTVTTDQKSLTLAAGAAATLNVSLTGTVPAAGEYSGTVTLTSSSPAVSLRMPYMFLVGDGLSPNVVPLYGESYYGAVGQDLGPIPAQVVDDWGVPVAGSTVTFTVTPRGGVTFKPVPGTPGGTGANVTPFVPSNCTPSTSTGSVTCTTNSDGIAWVEVIGGATPISDTNPATIDVVAAGQDVQISVSLIAVPALQNPSGGAAVADAALGGATIAPGSYVSLYGSNLVDPYYLTNSTGDSADATFSSGRLPLTWDGVTVSFDAAATGSLPAISVPGYVYFVSTGQVNVYAPWELEGYPSAQVKLTYAGSIRSNVVTVPVSNYTPAFLMYGSGSVLIADARDNNTGALITTTSPATAGEVLQLYCNGLGPVSNQPVSGDPAPGAPNLAQTTTPVTVSIGGQSAPVIFAGLTPPFVGLYLVDVTVPSGLTSGNQPITVSVAGKTSPLSVTSGSTTYNIVLPVK